MIRVSCYVTDKGDTLSPPRKSIAHTIASSNPSSVRRSNTVIPALPPILTTDEDGRHRPVSWQSQSSATSTATTSTVSPGFDDSLFDAFPAVPQDLPQVPFPTSPSAGITSFPRISIDHQQSATLPARSRNQSAQRLG